MNATTNYTAIIKSNTSDSIFDYDFSSVENATYDQMYDSLVSVWANRSGLVKKTSINSINLSFTLKNSIVKL